MMSEEEYDKYIGMVDAEELYSEFIDMLKCQDCGRLIVFWDGYRDEPTFYRSEE